MLQQLKHRGQTYSYKVSGTPRATDVIVTHVLEWAGGDGLFETKVSYL